jgi:SAM-dependent methyltransferase
VKKYTPGLALGLQQVNGFVSAEYFKLTNKDRPSFACPICKYEGPFADYKNKDYPIQYTRCPRCDLYERHRLQFLVMDELNGQYDFSKLSILHFAPEPIFQKHFRDRFATYHTADIEASGVDFEIDIRDMPFEDGAYDIVLASHVLEHVSNDHLAFAEIKRILKPSGFALLPVPVVSPYTIEYGEPNWQEFGHVRAVGVDYFERYKDVFSKVKVYQSSDFEERNQLYTYEDRSTQPTPVSPLRVPMEGSKHSDFVPVCFRMLLPFASCFHWMGSYARELL